MARGKGKKLVLFSNEKFYKRFLERVECCSRKWKSISKGTFTLKQQSSLWFPLFVFFWLNQYLCARTENINWPLEFCGAECLAELSRLNCLWFHCSVDRNKPWPDTRRCVCLHSSFYFTAGDPNGNTPTMLPNAHPAPKFLKALRSSADSESFCEMIISVCFSMYDCGLQLLSCVHCLCTVYSTSLPRSLGDVSFFVFLTYIA